MGIFMVLFERMHTLAGFENVLMGLLADRANADALADKILEAQMCLVRNYQERFGSAAALLQHDRRLGHAEGGFHLARSVV